MTNAEIQVGEYVRTKKHGIFKVTKLYEGEDKYYILNNDKDEAYTIGGNTRFNISKDIVNHSFNIIDLIEADDYIKMGKNNYYLGIDNIYEFAGELNIRTSNDFLWEDVKNDKDFTVYSIITHEQMESMEYKVGGEDDKC